MQIEAEKDWRSLGYTRAMQQCMNLPVSSISYPTRDIHTEADEEEYLIGYTEGMTQFQTGGYHPVMAYAEERK